MITNIHTVLADPRILPGDPQKIAVLLSGLSGAAFAVAFIGGLLGWFASWKIDELPAIVGIVLGIVGGFTLVQWLTA